MDQNKKDTKKQRRKVLKKALGIDKLSKTTLKKQLTAKDFGAKGDFRIAKQKGGKSEGTGSDDSTQLQLYFDQIGLSKNGNVERSKSLHHSQVVRIPEGVYHITKPLIIGKKGKSITNIVFDFTGSVIHAALPNKSTYALQMIGLKNCVVRGLKMQANDCSGMLVDTALHSGFKDICISASGDYCFKGQGYIMRCSFDNFHLGNAFHLGNLENTKGFIYDGRMLTSEHFSGLRACTFSNFSISGTRKGGMEIFGHPSPNAEQTHIYTNGSLVFDALSIEGCEQGKAIYAEACRRVIINGIWGERNHPNVHEDSWTFNLCKDITINSIRIGSHTKAIGFENCDNVSISNSCNLSNIAIRGVVDGLILDNVEFENKIGSRILNQNGAPTANIHTSIRGLQLRNVKVKQDRWKKTNYTYPTTLMVHGRPADQLNLVTPLALSSSPNIKTTNCTVDILPSATEFSPMGYLPSVLTCTGEKDPVICFTVDTSSFYEGSKTNCILLMCMKKMSTKGSPVYMMNPIACTRLDPIIYYYNDWIMMATSIELSPGEKTIKVKINPKAAPAAGEQFLFGGAFLYQGDAIKLPHYLNEPSV